MTGAQRPRLPDLAHLTDAQKDELILSLWETLRAIEGNAPDPAAGRTAAASHADLSEAIRNSRPSSRGHAPARGRRRRARFLAWRPLQWFVLLLAVGFLVDVGIGWHQRRILARKDRAALALRSAAFEGMFVELSRIAGEPDEKSFRATLTMQNRDRAAPLYVMLNPPRVFVQAGLAWHEVPSRAPPGAGWGVVRLEEAQDYSVLFEVPPGEWSELIPGYLHVLIESDMLVSRRAAPQDDLAGRNNRAYLYLKPHGADDAALKARHAFPGAPPLFIPMPPH